MKLPMKKMIMFITVLVIFCGMTGCTNQGEHADSMNPSSEESSEQKNENPELVAEVEEIMGIIEKSALKEEYEKEPFEEIVIELKNGEIDREICINKIRSILASYECAHTELYTFMNDPMYDKEIPLHFQRFQEGYFLMSCYPEYQEYLGMKLVSVNRMSVSETNEILAKLRMYETESGKKSAIEYGFFETEMKFFNLLNEQEQMEFILCDADGNEHEISAKMEERTREYIYMVKDEDSKPDYYKYFNSGIPFCYTGDAENGIMYFQYFSCSNNGETTVEEAVGQMMNEVEAYGTFTTLVFDVRFNHGGNRFLLRNALEKYRKEMNDMNIVIINGGETYSSAMQLSEDCLELFENVTIYGEETGQRIQNKTEIKEYSFEHLNCGFYVPTVTDCLPKLQERAEDSNKGVMPDVPVWESYSDYLNGIDTIYERVKEALRV